MADVPPTRVERPTSREREREPAADPVRLDEVTSVGELGDAGHVERYEQVRTLGRGGMGEVLLVQDHRIGRAIAVKVAHPDPDVSEALRRFVREARIQGQLDHPAVVPVYDLGVRPDGAIFFTMKRVRGVTLDGALTSLRRGDGDALHRFGRRRLLTAFIVMCQAIELAHARGVIHRDLKPANIMLGDYGEVYVLDWGVATLSTDPDLGASVVMPVAALGLDERSESRGVGAPAALPLGRGRSPLGDDGGDLTLTGTSLGTPGFMPPEQASGHPVDVRADVYALGATLFEILTWHPLHARGAADAMIASTMAGADARASLRYPERQVPPELEIACVLATAARLDERTPSVAALRAAVEAFLDGDRDVERRTLLADQLAAAAGEAVPQALAGDRRARGEAMQLASRALALAPDHPLAQSVVVRLTVTPPRETPPEVIAAVEETVRDTYCVVARVAAYLYISWLPLGAVVLWMGLRDVPIAVTWVVLIVATASAMYYGSMRGKYDAFSYFVGLVISSAALATTGRLFGPYVMAPTLLTVNAVAFLLHSRRAWRPGSVVIVVAALIGPIALEEAGLLATSTSIATDHLTIRATIAEFSEPATSIALIGLMVVYAVVIGLAAGRLRDRRVADELRVQLGAWQLAQLAPQRR